MWTDCIDESQIVNHLYKNKIPSLADIYFQDFIFSPGGTGFLTLVFNIEELPEKMPEKWKSRDVNAVQIAIEIVKPEIKHFELSTNNYNHLVFDISLIDKNEVKITIKDIIGRIVLEIEGISAYLKGLSGFSIGETNDF